MKNINWLGKRVLVIGAARQGLALARYLAGKGAQVILNDKRSAEALKDARDALAKLPVEWVCGDHPLSLLDRVDMICVSGGVPLNLPIIEEGLKRALPISNDSQIFMQACQGRVIGITGSAGKTTTTSLVGEIAREYVKFKQSERKVWVGGNIGLPLIEYVDQIQPDDIVILELSSFQLEIMTRSPHISAVLNITPNHLDRHGSMQVYSAAKARILSYQSREDFAILNRDDEGAWKLSKDVKGKVFSFGLRQPLPHDNGTFIKKNKLCLQMDRHQIDLFKRDVIQLPGNHNLYNVLAACAIAAAAGFALPAIVSAVSEFRGVAHRLEFIRNINGADWYNDSIATAPERSMAAIRSFEQPLVLLLGGRDKDLPWASLAQLIKQRVDHVVLFGEAAGLIADAIGTPAAGGRPYTIARCETLEQAVQAAAQVAEAGDVVLLSPGGTSYDAFIDFEERGNRFTQWVKELT